MAMVTITNGKDVTKVSQQMFENKFKRYGWRTVKQKTVQHYEEELAGTNSEEDIDTIPISDMNAEQLKVYAKKYDIDISKTKSAAEARKVIQTAIRNKNM